MLREDRVKLSLKISQTPKKKREREGRRGRRRWEKKEERKKRRESEGKARNTGLYPSLLPFSLKGHPREWHGTDMVIIHGVMEVTWKWHGKRWSFIKQRGGETGIRGWRGRWNPTYNFLTFFRSQHSNALFSYQPSDLWVILTTAK